MKKIGLKDILTYEFLSNIDYCPDGSKAAFVVSHAKEEENKYEGCIWLYENGKVRQLTGLGKERSFFWEDNENILFAANRTEAEQKRAKDGKEQFTSYYRINVYGGEATHAFTLPYPANSLKRLDENRLVVRGGIEVPYADYYKMTKEEKAEVAKKREEEKDYQVIDEMPFYFNGAGYVNKKRNAFYIYDMKKDKSERISMPKENVESLEIWKGKIYYTSTIFNAKRPRQAQLYEFDPETGNILCLYQGSEGDVEIRGLHPIGDRFFVTGTEHKNFGLNENAHVYEFDFDINEPLVCFEQPHSMHSTVGSDCRLGGGAQSRNKDKLYYVTTRRNAGHIYALDLSGEYGVDIPVFTEEGSVDCFDIKDDGSEILFIGLMGQKLQELYRIDAKGKCKQITNFNEKALKGKYVATPEKITVMSEGVDIDGWVLKPINFDENKTYPAIFDIHGGPKTVYGEVFYHEMQYWASEGYFVFYCNPTGSDGRGNEFADIRGKYGTIDYKNLMDFADAVLEKFPQIDKNRVGETGGSYGGFMTNWIVGHTDRFACAATQRSISNWVSFYGISDIGTYFGTDQTAGNIYENIDKMWEQSPLKYVDKVTTPLLFIHSDEDYRCPLSQGVQFYTALADLGREVRMCVFHGENHELSRSGKPKHRIRRLVEITNWMDKYLKK